MPYTHRAYRKSMFLAMSDDDSMFNGFLPSAGDAEDSSGMIPIAPKPLDKLEKIEVDRVSKLLQNVGNKDVLRYYNLVSSLAPNDMLLKFTKSAPSNVQEAAKSTVMNILGSLPNYVLDAALITTSSKLANLLYQMQITGYMFKNAEYRMSLTKSLRGREGNGDRKCCHIHMLHVCMYISIVSV